MLSAKTVVTVIFLPQNGRGGAKVAGRPRQPVDLLIAKGKKHLTKEEIEERRASEVKAANLKNINAPDYLTVTMQEEFYEIANKLLEINIMTELDEDCLARYILAKQMYLKYTSLLTTALQKKEVDEMERLMVLQDKAFKQCRAGASDLGLSISARARLIMPQVPGEEQPKNKFEKFRVI